jgi:peptidoglycan/LPS O-acetylase OafA/YrhL
MKSSTGKHYVGLDHVRAVAALMVFTWHFTHGVTGYPVSFEGAPWLFPLAFFDEGHTGVALFMVLSGYLFAKLLDGRAVKYLQFFWNRFLRLAPLLVLVSIIVGFLAPAGTLAPYLRSLLVGFILPTWPNGGWSITIEIQFYIALPLLLYLSRRWKAAPFVAVIIANGLRIAIFLSYGEVQDAAYWTIIGKADDFLMGIAAFKFREYFANKHALAAIIAICFTAVFWQFDYHGGFYLVGKSSPVWIILPTVEAIGYSSLVAYYDTTYRPSATGFSWAFSKIGEYSYSIYLIHPFFVFRMANFVQRHVMDISNFYLACAWALLGFSLMIPIGFVSYNYFELPFLRLRKQYIKQEDIAAEFLHSAPSVRDPIPGSVV